MITITKTKCSRCSGSGFKTLDDRLVIGPKTHNRILARAIQCDRCEGSGEVIAHNLRVEGGNVRTKEDSANTASIAETGHE